MLVSAGSDGAIQLWDLGTGLSTLLASDAHRGSPHVEFSTDGGTLASWSQSDQRIKVWDVKARRPLGEIPVGSGRDVGAVVSCTRQHGDRGSDVEAEPPNARIV